ncbi:Conserved_hypothetical protein [Hexamita inflata]|uniref:Uncharacterized protein n=1 Tax=Hexamita inflata TaxID=28002 RepID=A0AA86P5Y4_9EUKA|nr:Conserved hypothetical protein [Hexamita inflata]
MYMQIIPCNETQATMNMKIQVLQTYAHRLVMRSQKKKEILKSGGYRLDLQIDQLQIDYDSKIIQQELKYENYPNQPDIQKLEQMHSWAERAFNSRIEFRQWISQLQKEANIRLAIYRLQCASILGYTKMESLKYGDDIEQMKEFQKISSDIRKQFPTVDHHSTGNCMSNYITQQNLRIRKVLQNNQLQLNNQVFLCEAVIKLSTDYTEINNFSSWVARLTNMIISQTNPLFIMSSSQSTVLVALYMSLVLSLTCSAFLQDKYTISNNKCALSNDIVEQIFKQVFHIQEKYEHIIKFGEHFEKVFDQVIQTLNIKEEINLIDQQLSQIDIYEPFKQTFDFDDQPLKTLKKIVDNDVRTIKLTENVVQLANQPSLIASTPLIKYAINNIKQTKNCYISLKPTKYLATLITIIKKYNINNYVQLLQQTLPDIICGFCYNSPVLRPLIDMLKTKVNLFQHLRIKTNGIIYGTQVYRQLNLSEQCAKIFMPYLQLDVKPQKDAVKTQIQQLNFITKSYIDQIVQVIQNICFVLDELFTQLQSIEFDDNINVLKDQLVQFFRQPFVLSVNKKLSQIDLGQCLSTINQRIPESILLKSHYNLRNKFKGVVQLTKADFILCVLTNLTINQYMTVKNQLKANQSSSINDIIQIVQNRPALAEMIQYLYYCEGNICKVKQDSAKMSSAKSMSKFQTATIPVPEQPVRSKQPPLPCGITKTCEYVNEFKVAFRFQRQPIYCIKSFKTEDYQFQSTVIGEFSISNTLTQKLNLKQGILDQLLSRIKNILFTQPDVLIEKKPERRKAEEKPKETKVIIQNSKSQHAINAIQEKQQLQLLQNMQFLKKQAEKKK